MKKMKYPPVKLHFISKHEEDMDIEKNEPKNIQLNKDYTPMFGKVLKELLKKRVVEKIEKINSKFLNMPYYKNYAATSGKVHNITNHEDAVKDILISEDISPFEIKQTKKTILKWLDNPETSNNIMPINTFVYQPCGSHESPDFIVKFADSFILAIECKSSNTTIPLYNSGGIKSNYYYIFSSNSTNKTVTYMGYNIIEKQQQELIENHIKEARERDELLNKKLNELDKNNRGVCYYTRPMINQSGGGEYTNYFKHKNRKNDNYSVIDFVKSKL
jgi:hypothetical protein